MSSFDPEVGSSLWSPSSGGGTVHGELKWGAQGHRVTKQQAEARTGCGTSISYHPAHFPAIKYAFTVLAALQNMISMLTPNNLHYCSGYVFAAPSFTRNSDVCASFISVLQSFPGLVHARHMWDVFSFISVNPHLGDWNCFAHGRERICNWEKGSNPSKG